MGVHRFLVILILVASVGILLVWQEAQAVRRGYLLMELSRQKRILEEKIGAASSSVETASGPSSTLKRLSEMSIGLEVLSRGGSKESVPTNSTAETADAEKTPAGSIHEMDGR